MATSSLNGLSLYYCYKAIVNNDVHAMGANGKCLGFVWKGTLMVGS